MSWAKTPHPYTTMQCEMRDRVKKRMSRDRRPPVVEKPTCTTSPESGPLSGGLLAGRGALPFNPALTASIIAAKTDRIQGFKASRLDTHGRLADEDRTGCVRHRRPGPQAGRALGRRPQLSGSQPHAIDAARRPSPVLSLKLRPSGRGRTGPSVPDRIPGLQRLEADQ